MQSILQITIMTKHILDIIRSQLVIALVISISPATAQTNNPPTSADNTVEVTAGGSYTFSSGDFAFNDPDSGDSLQSITIVSISLPSDESRFDNTGATFPTVNDGDMIPVADIGNLVFAPDNTLTMTINNYASFTFTVNDGTDNSSPANTITISLSGLEDGVEVLPPGGSDSITRFGIMFTNTRMDGATAEQPRLVHASLPSVGGTTASSFETIYDDLDTLPPPPPNVNFSATPVSVDISIEVDGAMNPQLDAPVTVCLEPTAELQMAADDAGQQLAIYHFEDSAWVQLGSSITRAGLVCGDTDSFSPFALGFGTGSGRSFANSAWLARFGRTVASGAVDVISRRSELMSKAGNSYLHLGGRALNTDNPSAGLDNDFNLKQLLGRSAFQLAGGGATGNSRLVLWGNTTIRRTDGREQQLDIDGEVISGYIGLDYYLNNRWLAGIAISHSEAEADFNESNNRADAETSLSSIFPYVHWRHSEQLTLWGTVGYGFGDNDITDSGGRAESDIEMRMAAIGMRSHLFSGDSGTLAVKANALGVEIESDSSQTLENSDSDVQRLRLALEGSKALGSGLNSSLELGYRYDGGDAEDGQGLDISGGLDYNQKHLDINARAYWLAVHSANNFDEWGASLSINLSVDNSGLGPALSLSPLWGTTPVTGGTEQLWQRTSTLFNRHQQSATNDTSLLPQRVGILMSYGLSFKQFLLAPYGDFDLHNNRLQRLRFGQRLKFSHNKNLSLDLFGQSHQYDSTKDRDYSIGIESSLHF